MSIVILEPKKAHLLVPHYFPEFAQVHVHWIGDAIQQSHPLPPSSPPALSLSQHQGLFQQVSFLHQVTKVLEPLLQLHFLPLEWYHLHIWDYWYFSQQSWFQLVLHPAQHFAGCTLHIWVHMHIWVWASSRSWWWTGKPGVLQSMGLQRVGHNWVTELNWTLHIS